MKSNMLLMGMSALLVSVAGANAMEYRPFVGLAMGIQGLNYEEAFKEPEIDLPHDFIAFGFEAGTRFGSYDQIYNGGLSFHIDTTDSEKIRETFTNKELAKIKSTTLSATYDNYIRISGDKMKRIDLVLGAGIGTMNYHVDVVDATEDDETRWSTTLALKAGLDFALTKNITLSANMRLFVPTREHYMMETSYIAGGAIKYVF